MWYGYVILEGAVELPLIDKLLGDVDEAMSRPEDFSFLVLSDRYEHVPIRDTDPEYFWGQRMRLVGFHHPSVAAKQVSMHANIAGFVQHLFRQEIVMMQSLTFLEGSQQTIHQDLAFVIAKSPGHVCASWVALEDVDPAAGPLTYVPGSHAIPLFNWGNGMHRQSGATAGEEEFVEHIQRHCDAAGLTPANFCPKKGDVLIWHAALAHGGLPVTDSNLTRKSYITHYSTTKAFPRPFGSRERRPKRELVNGGVIYHDPERTSEENSLS